MDVTNYSTKDVAKMTGRTVETVRLWINDGKLRARKHPGGRDYIISKEDFDNFMSGDVPGDRKSRKEA